ncbi:hypothetical protein KSF_008790 [Reticulibacter mediterranei]|uniref:Zinc-ribbon domain-containing protein n=1 Tax=Reticulibacter mediterranei TaxID=2778369 RepID=A0A8J3IJP2_9CHLR|nr:zinc ribbon domain-containing protein [Reticulibacter mediterranei]GHO90831.1 hypothetical protein KSF_008790 [Reticulibacter mediterranei]
MFRCPKCHTELPADARFCNKCGFNHTNAMKAVSPQQAGSGPQNAARPPSPGNSGLTKRYPGNQPGLTPQGGPPIQQNMAMPPQGPASGSMPQADMVVRASTPPPPRTLLGRGQVPGGPQAPMPPGPQAPMPFGPQGMNQPMAYPPPPNLSLESLTATSQAAEHWRNSWRDRQRAEAGPAVGISRGQAVVPEPLMAIQQSLVRMRSIIMPNTQEKEASPVQKQLYRISSILLFCLILGLTGYIISTFIPHTLEAAKATNKAYGVYPTIYMQLNAKNPKPAAKAGQALAVHGDSFKTNTAITFTLDTTAINVTAQTNKDGSFDSNVTIPSNQLPGSYTLIAKGAGQQASMNVHVLPAGAANNTPLTLTNDQGQTVSKLAFNTVNGYDPNPEILTITNTGATKVTWSASIVTENAQNWITLNASKTAGTQYGKVGGEIAPDGTDTIAVNVSAMGLASLMKKAYQGYVIFTVDRGQFILPVSFAVQNKSLDLVVTPNPLTVISNGDHTCKPTTMGIINNSDQPIIWNAGATNGNIQLSPKNGQLDPAGSGNDAVTLQITCGGIDQQVDNFSVINVFFNGKQVSVQVNVRPN